MQSVKWAGAPPALWLEHGPEQRRAAGSGATRLPYIAGAPLSIMVRCSALTAIGTALQHPL